VPSPEQDSRDIATFAREAAQKLIDQNQGILDSDTIAPVFGIQPAQRQTKVIVCFSGKGGTGKTTTAVLLAHIASTIGGVERVVLLDANRGQGDVRTYLGVKSVVVPSMYDLTHPGIQVKDIMISPDQMKNAIGNSTIRFYTVLAPRAEDANPEKVSNMLYTSAIDQLMSNVDLIVIDTQTSEVVDVPAIMTQVMVPILRGNPNGYAVGIPDSSMPGIRNTQAIARSMINAGVKAEQISFLFNRMAIGADVAQLQGQMRGLGRVVAAVQADPNVTRRPDLVNGINTNTQYAKALMSILYEVTKAEKLQRMLQEPEPAQPSVSGSRRIFSFLKKDR
jgi:CO dehydrogenase nickel-insertion accessory protein CooC1